MQSIFQWTLNIQQPPTCQYSSFMYPILLQQKDGKHEMHVNMYDFHPTSPIAYLSF